MYRGASIDLGTNTCLMLIAEGDRRRIARVEVDLSTVVRLGQGVDQSRMLHPDAIARTLSCLKAYANEVQSRGLSPVNTHCVATSQARDAKNGAEFFSQVEGETGFKFKVLSGKQEARASFTGALLPGMDPEQNWVIDIGGGSTEIVSREKGLSLDMGAVRFTERFLKTDPVTDTEFWSAQAAIDQMLLDFKSSANMPVKGAKSSPQLVAVAGTAVTLAAMTLGLSEFNSQAIDQAELSRGDIHRIVEELKWRTLAERKMLTGIEAARADVLLAGAMILWRTLEVLGFSNCRVSSRGLRYGVLQEGFSSLPE